MEFFQKIFNYSPHPKTIGALSWINGIKGMDDISAIEYSTQQLNIDFKNEIFQNDQHLEALFSIDEKTHMIVERVTAHYTNIDHISIGLEERIASAVFLYHRQIFLIYLTLIENNVTFDKHSLLIMLARAINSATQMIKWRYYKYQSAPADVWLQISKLFKIAENQSLLNSSVQLYPSTENNEKEPITLSSAYINACMLGTLESLSFKCQQIELVSKILTEWTPKILIKKEYDEKKHIFYVDTACNIPAKRIRNITPEDTYRYWCLDSINAKIELCISLIEFKISPKQETMKALINNKYAFETLQILRSEWSRTDYKRQRRSGDRVKVIKSATTAYGFNDTCDQIKQFENLQVENGEVSYKGNKSFDERLASHYISRSRNEPTDVIYVDLGAGYSNIVDESSKGIGLHISKQANEISLGMILGISVKEKKYATKICIIRSIKPIVGNELHIGVEVLSRNAFCVDAINLSQIATKSSSNITIDNSAAKKISLTRKDISDSVIYFNSPTNFTCLLLPKELSTSKQESLILPKIQYNKNDVFKINISGSDILVKFTEVIDQHENWIRVAYTQDFEK